ncbi:MAG: hypothetical protein A2W00_10135 [Candidatus Eisenbacteria bacterium RBG_16_71_46]|nr:MAG: hypothetical protein A2W00_10135 [Candidatus Eisenbacteria bacterium RBG_16_71_46]
MKRFATQHRSRLLLAGALVAVAGIAWAGLRPQAPEAGSSATGTTPAVALVAPEAAAPAVTPAPANTPKSRPARQVAAAAPAAVAPAPVAGEAGMRIFLDPETGAIGPPPVGSLSPAPEGAIEEPSANLREQMLPDGSVMIDLQGQFQEYTIIQLDANGRRIVRCATDPAAAMRPAPAPAPQREEE